MIGDETIGEKILRQLNYLQIATVVLALIIGAIVGYLFYTVNRTDRALCDLRSNLQRTVHSSRDFLDKHPEGFAGIPAAAIQKGIRDSQRTVDALEPLRCPPVKFTD